MRIHLLLLLTPLLAPPLPAQDDGPSTEFFEKKIRPVLVERCYSCHSAGATKLKGGLRLDSREAALKGGDSGPALVPGHPEKSPIIEAVAYGNVDLRMPPKGKLPAAQIADLSAWVKSGAPWPADASAGAGPRKTEFNLEERRASHWAWAPLRPSAAPPVKNGAWPRRPLDKYLLASLEARGLEAAAAVDARTLLRRLSFALNGLPLANEELEAFAADPSDAAYDRIVDRLLASPRFGETWARHWLDLMRYAESRGQEFDYLLPNAWHYRDYVIRAMNDDLPFAQFVTEHVAGDLLPEPRRNPTEGFNESILATGWWYLGEWLHSPVDTRADEMDRVASQIEVFGKSFFGLTISCARCHDHKFDAISQKDFYAIAGFLKSAGYRQARFDTGEDEKKAARELEALRTKREAVAVEAALRAPRAAVERLAALLQQPDEAWAAHLKKAFDDPRDPFYGYARGAAAAATLRARLEKAGRALEDAEIVADFTKPGAVEWTQDGVTFRRAAAGDAEWGSTIEGVLPFGALVADPLWRELRPAPKTESESSNRNWVDSGRMARTATFTQRRSKLYSLVRGAGHAFVDLDGHRLVNGPLHGASVATWKEGGRRWVAQPMQAYRSPDPEKPLHRLHVEYTPESPEFAVLMVVQADAAPGDPFDRPDAGLLQAVESSKDAPALAAAYQKRFRDALDRRDTEGAALADFVVRHPELFAPAGAEAAEHAAARRTIAAGVKPESRLAPAILEGPAADEYLLVRGFYGAPKEVVPRRYLEAFGGAGRIDRLELARRMTDPAVTPLVPRVMVNRIWHQLFGRGLVPSVDDFGRMGYAPTHPELLDALALDFVQRGWSVKAMIREIVRSSAFRISTEASPKATELDGANTLWQHREARRLGAEALRDAMLAVSGRLDPALYGKPVPIHLDGFQDGRGKPGDGPLDGAGRRSIYLSVRRNFLSSMLLAFDFPQPATAMGRRSVSNVPAQALILRNNPFVHDQALFWAKRLVAEGRPANERIDGMFRAAFARPASPEEIDGARVFLEETAALLKLGIERPEVWKELCHALFQAKEFLFLR